MRGQRAAKPNALVAHLEQGLAVLHLADGALMCQLHLASPGLHADLNGDGVPDHVSVRPFPPYWIRQSCWYAWKPVVSSVGTAVAALGRLQDSLLKEVLSVGLEQIRFCRATHAHPGCSAFGCSSWYTSFCGLTSTH